MSSNVANNDNNCSETLNLFDTAFNHIRHKKNKEKYLLLQDVQSDVSGFIQKLSLYNKDEYQTVIHKRMIATIEKKN